MCAKKTTLDMPDALYREFKAQTELPEWAGIAEPFVTKYPNNLLDNKKMRDEIVSTRREGLV